MNQNQTESKDLAQLIAAVCAVMQAVPAVQKTGYNDHHKFSFASDADLLRALQPVMAQNGLALIPVEARPETKQHGQTSSGKTTWRTDLVAKYALAHVSGAVLYVEAAGAGIDTEDKSPAKAATMALKYALCQSFLIPRLDDPDFEAPYGNGGNGHAQAAPKSAPAAAPAPGAAPKPAPKPAAAPGPRGGGRPIDAILHREAGGAPRMVDGKDGSTFIGNWKDLVVHVNGAACLPWITFGKHNGKHVSDLSPGEANAMQEWLGSLPDRNEKLDAIYNALWTRATHLETEQAQRNEDVAAGTAKPTDDDEIPF
jgi:hypothetical protein